MDAAVENGFAFVRAIDKHKGDYNEFLHRDSYIPVRGSTVSQVEDDLILEYVPDIDGVVIEWHSITGSNQCISHVQIVPPQNVSLKYVYPVIKKHANLKQFNGVSRDLLRVCVASQLFYSDGWETWLGFVPKCNSKIAYTKEIIRTLSHTMLYDVKSQMQRRMKAMRVPRMAENTLLKNNLNDLARIFILPNDQDVVLQALQSSIDGIDMLLNEFRTIIITFRFGDKCNTEVPLPIADTNAVRCVSVHVGLEIGASYPKIDVNVQGQVWDLLWCREGVQLLVGCRGSICKTFSFTECINYQSNLDGRTLDINPDLKAVCSCPESLRFVQFYGDIPHRYPKCRMHAVSAAIIIPTGIHKSRSIVDRDAKTYISEVENNFSNLQRCKCRLEFVVCLPDVCNTVNAYDLIDMAKVRKLLHRYQLLAPFRHPEFSGHLRGIGLYLVSVLANLFDKFKGTGESNAVWRAYQNELAIEKLLWGRPLCSKSRIYAINLGPGVDYASRSQTDSLGFLSLVESTSCCVDEFTTPPLSIYSGSQCVCRQIAKVFGIFDFIGGSNIALGRRLVLLLLKDLHEIGNVIRPFPDFLLTLKVQDGKPSGYSVVGGSTVMQLIGVLLSAKKAKYPMVFVYFLKMLTLEKVDISKAIEDGIEDLNLMYFPAIRLHDRNNNPGICWLWHQGLWVLTNLTNASCEETLSAKAMYLTPLVVREMDNRKLCHGSTLTNRILPWIKPILVKLRDLELSEDKLVLVLTFVTSVALLMSGKYVDYNGMSRLDSVMPVNQRKLQVLEILSKLTLNNFNKFRLWRLHHSVPFKMQESKCSSVVSDSIVTDDKEERVIDLEPTTVDLEPQMLIADNCAESETTALEFIPTRHLPSNYRARWSPAEISVVGIIAEKYANYRQKDQYDIYTRECAALSIPDRSFKAFCHIMERLHVDTKVNK